MSGERYHFIGLGGIGMSALARILLQKGCQVQGSDQTSSPLLEQLRSEGAFVKVGHDAGSITEGTTVVYSSGIEAVNEELIEARRLDVPILHRSDLLDRLMQGKKPLLVTGTHGKTTTSALLASVLLDAQLDPSFVVGGILRSFNTNGRFGNGPFFVAEADESDGSFLKTSAFGAIVTNLENDHLDYWENEERLNKGFQKFLSEVQSREHLFWCCDDDRLCSLDCRGVSYGFSKNADLRIDSFMQTEQGIRFDLCFQGKKYCDIDLALFGRHSALNGAAVFGLALKLQISEEQIRKTFAAFGGTRRRMEFKGEAHTVKVFDDYGHHPTEIAVTLKGLRHHVGEKRLVAIFQPHRYTRVRDLFDEFLGCFHDADIVILTDIYSAGESSIEGISTASLYTRMKEVLGSKLYFLPRPYLEAGAVDLLQLHDVVLTIGAGDVTQAGDCILKLWKTKAPKIRVALLCGGTSAEHEVSIQSAINIDRGLDRSIYDVSYFGVTKQGRWLTGSDVIEKLLKKIQSEEGGAAMSSSILEQLQQCDVCLPVFHGPQGEDGMIQGFLEALQLPYAGCDYRSSALCMHKGWTKQIALMHSIPTSAFFLLELHEYRENPKRLLDRIRAELRYPIWIKPVHLGSSFGVSRVDCESQVIEKAEFAFSYDHWIIIEEHVEGRQIEFGIIGNEALQVGPPCEILNQGAFVDYAGKYGASAMPYAIPAGITELQKSIGIDLAKKTYAAAGCKGLARIDFFLDGNGHYWLNEINPFPGCTDTSAFPKIWANAGVSMQQICDRLVICALHRARRLGAVQGK